MNETTMPIFVLEDIDENIIASRRTCPDEGGRPVATDSKDKVCGYITPKQERLLAWLQAGCTVVPTTARSSAAYARLDLGLTGWAILSFGGIIMQPDGTPEPRWQAYIEQQVAAHRDALHQLNERVRQFTASESIDARSNIISDFGMDFYLSIKHNQRDNYKELERVHQMLLAELPAGWQLHFNMNLLAVIPPYLGKEHAAKWFIDNIVPQDALLIGSGDSITDLPFMELCDFVLFPTKSQNFRRLLKEVANAIVSR